MWKFIITSDFHFGFEKNYNMFKHKQHHLDVIKKINKEGNLKYVISAGDLVSSGKDINEVKSFVKNWVEPIEEDMNLKLLLCDGNHDYVEKSKNNFIKGPLIDYLIKRNGNLCYTTILNNFVFICCGLVPVNNNFEWLKNELKKYKNCLIVLFWHYHLTGDHSDRWSDNQKKLVYDLIKEYNIKGVVVGHQHKTSITYWNKKIPILNGSGKELIIVIVDKFYNIKFKIL